VAVHAEILAKLKEPPSLKEFKREDQESDVPIFLDLAPGSNAAYLARPKGFLSCWRKEIQVTPEVLTIESP
jgi:hypothetical protein